MKRIIMDFGSSDLLGGNCLNRDLWDSMICGIMGVGCGLSKKTFDFGVKMWYTLTNTLDTVLTLYNL